MGEVMAALKASVAACNTLVLFTLRLPLTLGPRRAPAGHPSLHSPNHPSALAGLARST